MAWVDIGFKRDLLDGPRSLLLDHLRWWSAMAVVLAHARNLLFPDYTELSQVTGFIKIFYFFTLFGTQAVVVFFVVSGLLIGGKVLVDVRDRRFSLARYSLDRAVRLYVVLVPAVILSVALARVFLYEACADSVWTVVGNLIFFQNFIVEPLCNNHPLWSLSNEAFYYAFAGMIGAAFAYRRGGVYICLLLVSLGLVLWRSDYSPVSIVGAAMLWLLGLLPWFLRVRLPAFVFGSLFLIVLVLSRIHFFENGYVEKFAIAALLSLTLSSNVSWCVPWGAWASKFSYSMYLIHMPIAQVLYLLIGRLSPFELNGYLIFVVVILFIVGVSWVFWYFFESRTSNLRRWLGSRLKLP